MPKRLLAAIETRAMRTGRKLTGQHRSNRASRWTLSPEDPQFGTREDCQTIFIRLLAMLMEFADAPRLPREIEELLERYLGRPLQRDSYRDSLTLQRLSYAVVFAECETPRPGHSVLHIGHRDPRLRPKHVPTNVEWREARSNLIQGEMTLDEARTRFVELIARYFGLGEVHIVPD